jgi:hypothetical protein
MSGWSGANRFSSGTATRKTIHVFVRKFERQPAKPHKTNTQPPQQCAQKKPILKSN